MQISVTKPELENYVHEQVKEGRFASPADVVEAAIARLMLEPEDVETFDENRLASLRRSHEQIVRGEVRPFEEAAAQLRQKHLDR